MYQSRWRVMICQMTCGEGQCKILGLNDLILFLGPSYSSTKITSQLLSLQPTVSLLIVSLCSRLVLQARFSYELLDLMMSRQAARQSNVVRGGIKLCFRGNSQWQVTTVPHKVSSPHRDSLGCGVEGKHPCKSTSDRSKSHINNMASVHCIALQGYLTIASTWGVRNCSWEALLHM